MSHYVSQLKNGNGFFPDTEGGSNNSWTLLVKTMNPLSATVSALYSWSGWSGSTSLVAENRKLSQLGLDGVASIPQSKVCNTGKEQN